MSRLRDMIARRVDSVRTLHGYWQIEFGKATLTVINPIHATRKGVRADPTATLGLQVVDVIEGSDQIKFDLEDEVSLTIDMRPESHICPEAMTLVEVSLPTVVW